MTFVQEWFFFSSRRRHTRYWRDWSSDVCSSDLTNNLAGLHCIRRNVNNFTVNNNMLMTYHLTSCCTCGSDTQTENNVIKTALQVLKQYLTGNTLSLCSFLKHITELTLKHTIGELSFLLLCQHDTEIGRAHV